MERGIDLHGVCLFPGVDMPDWHNGEWVKNGLADIDDSTEEFRRIPVQSYCAELRKWQKRLNRVTELDEDPFSDPVNLADIVAAAKAMERHSDRDWH